MKKITKAFITALSFILIISLMPFSVMAEEGMGSESPYIEAVFTDEDGNSANGDALEAGEYTVEITLSGMAGFNYFELTADYTDDIEISNISTLADVDESAEALCKNEDNNFAVMVVTSNDDFTPISDGVAMITMQVTVNTPGDFEEFFVVDENPDHTFVGASNAYGENAAYVCTSNEATTNNYPKLSYDMSPDMSPKDITVTGKITISEDLKGTSGKFGIVGIQVFLGDEMVAESDADGNFTATVPIGTTELTLVGPTTVDRTVTLSGTENIEGVNIPIIVCNYNKTDDYINLTDYGVFLRYDKTDYVYANLEASDDIVNLTDYGVFLRYMSSDPVEYSALSLD